MESELRNLTSGQKDELMDQVKQQLAVANAQELLSVRLDITSHTFFFSLPQNC